MTKPIHAVIRAPSTEACMGGWCRKREHCPQYRPGADDDASPPAERLCEHGADGVGITRPVVIRMPVGSWELGASALLLRPANPMEILS